MDQINMHFKNCVGRPTWHEPITTMALLDNVTSQSVQETFGFTVGVKELQLGHSALGTVGMLT